MKHDIGNRKMQTDSSSSSSANSATSTSPPNHQQRRLANGTSQENSTKPTTNVNDKITTNNHDSSSASSDSNSNNNNNSNQLDNDNVPDYNHQCYICDKIFSANSNLNRHLRKIHQEDVQSPYNNVKCALCDSVYSSSAIYNNHLESDHQVKIDVEHLTFNDRNKFEAWKHQVETETTSQFIKSRGEKRTKSVNKTYYSCNRSGYYVSKARTRKALKKQGSRKINGRCPASMNVTVNPDESYSVRFVKTHVGHDFELKHLDLSDKDRDLILQKLGSGVTKRDIIKQIRSAAEQQHISNSTATTSASPASMYAGVCSNNSNVEVSHAGEIIVTTSSGVAVTATAISAANNSTNASNNLCPPKASRLHLATTKDIHNIINSKHLSSKLIRHNYDLNNVEAWIQEMKEYQCTNASVLLYKTQSETIYKFPKLQENDFMLVLMKDGQAEILKTHGYKCIIIDSTHNVHCECLHVTTLSVVDDDLRVFPSAFLFSSRTDVDTLEAFFATLKDKVGTIPAKIVIADECNDFYFAWSKVMARPTHNLLAPWSVFDAWLKNFHLIQSKEKSRRIKKTLRALVTESDVDKFSKALKQLVDDCKKDPDSREFGKFFEENYARNPDVWSSCLRMAHGISNFQLMSMHDKFKMICKEGKNSKKLCKYIANLMNIYDCSQIDLLLELEAKNPAKKEALMKRHEKSRETESVVYEVAVEPVYWLCPSESSTYYEVYYEVKHRDNPAHVGSESDGTGLDRVGKCCDLKCPTCETCQHVYKCTCLDYVVNLNMCKHIHKVCTICK